MLDTPRSDRAVALATAAATMDNAAPSSLTTRIKGNYDLRAITTVASANAKLGSKLYRACYAGDEAEALRLWKR